MAISDLSPVLILSLDTTTRAGSAAVLADDAVLAVSAGDGSRTHGERLPGELERVLAAAGVGLSSVDLLAVASGPGAFTGLRIGLAAMQGLSMAIGRPVLGISALDALAVSAFDLLDLPQARIGCWMDAARGEVFAALYDAVGRAGDVPMLSVVVPPEAASPEAVWSGWGALLEPGLVVAGDGASRYESRLTPGTRVVVHPLLAPTLGRLARRALAAGATGVPHELQPLYVRRPDVGQG